MRSRKSIFISVLTNIACEIKVNFSQKFNNSCFKSKQTGASFWNPAFTSISSGWCADDNNHHMLVLRPKNRILWSSNFCLRHKSQWSIDYVYMMLMNLRITASVSFHIIYIWHIAMIMATIITVASHSVQLNPKKCN